MTMQYVGAGIGLLVVTCGCILRTPSLADAKMMMQHPYDYIDLADFREKTARRGAWLIGVGLLILSLNLAFLLVEVALLTFER